MSSRRSAKGRMTVLSVAIILTGLTAGCREASVRSQWREREITVDGSRADWQGIDVYSFDDKQVFLGVSERRRVALSPSRHFQPDPRNAGAHARPERQLHGGGGGGRRA